MVNEELIAACQDCVEEFAQAVDALETTVDRTKKRVIFTVVGRLYKLEFVYTIKAKTLCPPSTLFVRVYPLKTRLLYLHLCELMAVDDLRCTYFPYMESPDRVRVCFAALRDVLETYLPVVETLALDAEAYDRMLRDHQASILEYASIAPEKVPTEAEEQAEFWRTWTDFYERFALVGTYTTDRAYLAFVRGDLKTARRLYEKRAAKNRLGLLDGRIVAFLRTPAAETYSPAPAECLPIFEGNELNEGKQEGAQIFATAGVLYVILLVVCLLLAFCCYGAMGRGASYVPTSYVMSALLPLLPAVFGGIALRPWVLHHVIKKERERLQAVDSLINSKGMYRFVQVLTAVCLIACLWLSAVFCLSATRFYADRMVYDDAENFPFLHGVTYEYADLEKVYYIEGRYNVYDEYIDRGSYVLVFTDEQVVDLDGSLSVSQTAEHVLPLLQPYVEGVTVLHSDRDLAKLYGKTAEQLFGW